VFRWNCWERWVALGCGELHRTVRLRFERPDPRRALRPATSVYRVAVPRLYAVLARGLFEVESSASTSDTTNAPREKHLVVADLKPFGWTL